MLNRVYIPHPLLQEFIVSFSCINATLPENNSDIITPYPPTPHQSILFYGEDRISMKKNGMENFEFQASTMIIGPQYTRVNLKVKKHLKAVRVDFHPGGLYRLLGVPMKEMFDEGYDALDILGPEASYLNEQIVNTESIEERKNVVEIYFLKKCSRLKIALPFDEAMRKLLLNDGNIPIKRLASLACLSLRQFERKCFERVGMPPKSFARIARFSKAYRMREAHPELTWTKVAHEAGLF
jgi:hypothetical protein